jgi:hypothetical protein
MENKPLRLRARYMLEKQQIQDEIGDLKQILETLGLSQRRACQLLLVDPSAWTRWSKMEAPPHIYKALHWLLQLQKLNPAAVEPQDLAARLDFVQSSTQIKIKELEKNVQQMEKAISLSPAASQESLAQMALREQERRFQEKISSLEAKIQTLLATQLRPKKNKPLRKSPKKLQKTSPVRRRRKLGSEKKSRSKNLKAKRRRSKTAVRTSKNRAKSRKLKPNRR